MAKLWHSPHEILQTFFKLLIFCGTGLLFEFNNPSPSIPLSVAPNEYKSPYADNTIE
jgi:hypothetical protein